MSRTVKNCIINVNIYGRWLFLCSGIFNFRNGEIGLNYIDFFICVIANYKFRTVLLFYFSNDKLYVLFSCYDLRVGQTAALVERVQGVSHTRGLLPLFL